MFINARKKTRKIPFLNPKNLSLGWFSSSSIIFTSSEVYYPKLPKLEYVFWYFGWLAACSVQLLCSSFAVWFLSFQFIRLDYWTDPVQDEIQSVAAAWCRIWAHEVRPCLFSTPLAFLILWMPATVVMYVEILFLCQALKYHDIFSSCK